MPARVSALRAPARLRSRQQLRHALRLHTEPLACLRRQRELSGLVSRFVGAPVCRDCFIHLRLDKSVASAPARKQAALRPQRRLRHRDPEQNRLRACSMHWFKLAKVQQHVDEFALRIVSWLPVSMCLLTVVRFRCATGCSILAFVSRIAIFERQRVGRRDCQLVRCP